jgi:hypothetical protein
MPETYKQSLCIARGSAIQFRLRYGISFAIKLVLLYIEFQFFNGVFILLYLAFELGYFFVALFYFFDAVYIIQFNGQPHTRRRFKLTRYDISFFVLYAEQMPVHIYLHIVIPHGLFTLVFVCVIKHFVERISVSRAVGIDVIDVVATARNTLAI